VRIVLFLLANTAIIYYLSIAKTLLLSLNSKNMIIKENVEKRVLLRLL